ncbi:MAG: hypothetical protein J2P15_24385, partial [Micromonosporaceae bacterium]|nr:hypothetical protein [Micromonosporaceae bacterium]
MAVFGRAKTATGAGVIATLVLILAFGNQAFTEWVGRHSRADTVWGWFLRQLSWPSWAFGPSDSSSAALRNLIARDLRALFLLVFVAAILGLAGKALVGGAGGFILGWASVVFASALAAFVTVFIAAHSTWLGA